MQSTLQLFKHLYNTLPPLFPTDTKEEMARTIEQFESTKTYSLEELENSMIAFGFEVWPWREAYKECYFKIESAMGEHFLLPRLSSELQEKYHTFQKNGGTFEDLHRGKNLAIFSPEDRGYLCEALVNMQNDIRQYVAQHIGSTEKKFYFSRVEHYKHLVQNIRHILETLRNAATAEQEHPMLTDEIHAKIRSFEESLCLLGGELNYTEVCQAPEFFQNRREHLHKLKGINKSVEIDFYNV